MRDSAAPDKILIAGTGAESTAETIEHTHRAAKIGYAAALVRTPSFYKPAMNEHTLAEHYLRVADASSIPVMVYSVPIFTHVTVEAPLIARVVHHPNIVGIKDSSGNVEGVAAIIAAAPKHFQTLVGSAATLYESLEARRGGRDPGIGGRVPGAVLGDLRILASRRSRESLSARAKIAGSFEDARRAIRDCRIEVRVGPPGLLRRPAAPSAASRRATRPSKKLTPCWRILCPSRRIFCRSRF